MNPGVDWAMSVAVTWDWEKWRSIYQPVLEKVSEKFLGMASAPFRASNEQAQIPKMVR